MTTEWGVGAQTHVFLTSALAAGESSASRPGRFTPGERAPGTHWIGGWVVPTAGLDDMEKWKFLPQPGLLLRPFGRPARKPVAIPSALIFNEVETKIPPESYAPWYLLSNIFFSH
jgi:hypothetical protein